MTLRTDYSDTAIEIYREPHHVPLITQHARPNKRPYIHPIVAPDGFGVLTENAPPHHPWQHGLYVGLNAVNGIGFWAEGDADGTFHPSPLKTPNRNQNHVSWEVTSAWKTPDSTHLLTESQHWFFHDGGAHYELDMV